MKIHTTNYKDTLIEVAEDCPVRTAQIPPLKRNKTLANIQYEIISKNPYKFTSDEIMFQCFVQKNDISENEKEAANLNFFAKGQACFRSSALAKRYGFGIHSNSEGKVALFPVESSSYENFLADKSVEKIRAMRSKRAE